MALMATQECFEVEELATKVIPAMSFCLLDKEKCVEYRSHEAMLILTATLVTDLYEIKRSKPWKCL